MTYFRVSCDLLSESTSIERYGTKEGLLEVIQKEIDEGWHDCAVNNYARARDIGQKWECTYGIGTDRCLIIKGEIIAPSLSEAGGKVEVP